MNLDKLYEKYGKASVSLELAQLHFNAVKSELATALKKAEEVSKEKTNGTKEKSPKESGTNSA